jgi:hypothetical protein
MCSGCQRDLDGYYSVSNEFGELIWQLRDPLSVPHLQAKTQKLTLHALTLDDPFVSESTYRATE